ncbi:uncharacterized protein LOC143461130 [Clavelina lepadiformis]|uniref:Uncharacterized protein n=2 Tax=Clavelina lepadiformis TaxID=159417 RepID=A0ABP0GBC4_CLALP
MAKTLTTSITFLLVVFLYDVTGHVVLTFPPARPFAFDFLDNSQSEGPCGMTFNKEHKIMTSLAAGTPFNVTWHVAYPHLGGIKLQLLDTEGAVLSELTDSNFIYKDDSTRLNHEVTLKSDIACDHCVLRIIKQASEWTNQNTSDGYLFWSCADVTMVSDADVNGGCYDNKCLNGGTCESGKCACAARYEGGRCEHENECADDGDCAHGRCVDVDSTKFPSKFCFCEPGWMGGSCEKESELSEAKLDESDEKDFHKVVLYDNPKFELFWKLFDDRPQVEIALRVETDTWCAIGWRPDDIDKKCKDFPLSTSSSSEGDDGVNDETSDNNDVEATRRKRFISLKYGRGQQRARRELVDKRDNDENMIKVFCNAGNISAAAEWAKETFNDVRPSSDKLHPEPEPKPNSKSSPSSNRKTKGDPEPEPNVEPGPGYKDILHPMDCSDIIYATAEGNLHRVLDMYTRDRASPKHDPWFGGSDDLTGVVARREDGILHVKFRRNLVSSDPSDHSLRDDEVMLIWARGQTSYLFNHRPLSGLESCAATDYDYYRINELKYHGTKPSQRGTTSFNFYDDPDDESKSNNGSFRHPEKCKTDKCEYMLEWKYREKTGLVHFKIKARVEEDQWAAVGFSEKPEMENSDAAVGWVEPSSGELTLTDRWLTSKAPEGVALDNGPASFENVRGSYRDGFLKISFSRALDTEDPNDLALNKCVYFLYAWGGKLKDGDVTKHKSTYVSEETVCIGSSARSRGNFNCLVMLCVVINPFVLFF